MRMAGTLDEAWQAIESTRKHVIAHERRLLLVEKDVSHVQEKQEDTCAQLKKTDENISTMIKDNQLKNDVKLDFLIGEYNKQQGKLQATNWWPTILQCIVMCIAIYTFITKAPL